MKHYSPAYNRDAKRQKKKRSNDHIPDEAYDVESHTQNYSR